MFYNRFSFDLFLSEIRESLKQQVLEWKNNLPNFAPGLRIVQVGGREDSNVYIRMKIKAANEIGIAVEHVKLPRSTTEIELLEKVRRKVYKYYISFILKYFVSRDSKISFYLISDIYFCLRLI